MRPGFSTTDSQQHSTWCPRGGPATELTLTRNKEISHLTTAARFKLKALNPHRQESARGNQHPKVPRVLSAGAGRLQLLLWALLPLDSSSLGVGARAVHQSSSLKSAFFFSLVKPEMTLNTTWMMIPSSMMLNSVPRPKTGMTPKPPKPPKGMPKPYPPNTGGAT